jgi:hypothetical protein
MSFETYEDKYERMMGNTIWIPMANYSTSPKIFLKMLKI